MYLFNQSVLFKITNRVVQSEIDRFITTMYTQEATQMKINNNVVQIPEKRYALTINQQWYLLHVNQFEHLKKHFDTIGIKVNPTELKDETEYKHAVLDLKARSHFVPRDYQEKIIAQIASKQTGNNIVPIQTGKGKTFIAMEAISRLQMRCGIMILPTYIEKWIGDITEILDTTSDNINVIKGRMALADAIALAKEDDYHYDFTIFSLRTMQNFVKDFIQNRDDCSDLYGCTPLDLIPLLKIGVMISDESHQHFHALFLVMLTMNVKRLIGLSATFLTEDVSIKKAHDALYPEETIDPQMVYDRYATVIACSYSIHPTRTKYIRSTVRGSTFYSHIAFEKSILRNKTLKRNYLELIKSCVDGYYMKGRDPRDRLLIFVSTTKMATIVTDYLKHCYPNYDIRRYCEADPYQNLMEAQISISTHQSAGTAKDIPDLRVCIQTVSISAMAANLQSLGRLRKLPDRDVTYVYLYAQQIRKQVNYHFSRKELFRTKALKFLDHLAPKGL